MFKLNRSRGKSDNQGSFTRTRKKMYPDSNILDFKSWSKMVKIEEVTDKDKESYLSYLFTNLGGWKEDHADLETMATRNILSEVTLAYLHQKITKDTSYTDQIINDVRLATLSSPSFNPRTAFNK